ncbi:recombinase family protein [Aeromonas sp. FDAARGOS 1408]|uniref:recombinase family protein n=1 Tax=Aeromonas TaxID=642 RepID=UPI001C24C9F0|nr:recombinase family protein [Aeromonas sp. FDAARGOS 1408]QXC09081.1 recombinase family protein [Aeromonas sp. FDAARGOS 1408]
MGRVFGYGRVSTVEQTSENQLLAIRNAGYEVQDSRWLSEVVSGSVSAMERPMFSNLVLNKLEAGDTVVVLKLDRLGRDNIDVQNTVSMLCEKGVKLVCLDLPVSNLSSPEGKLMLQLMGAFAEFERNRIRERTVEGLVRAKAEGKKLGRPEATETTEQVQKCKDEGLSQSETAKALNVGIATVKRHWNKTI